MTAPALSVKQVAELLGLSQHQILTLLNSGELRGVDVSLTPGGRPRWRMISMRLSSAAHTKLHPFVGADKTRNCNQAIFLVCRNVRHVTVNRPSSAKLIACMSMGSGSCP